MKKIYFAGPLFCESEKEYNLKLAWIFEDAGYKVFLPQRDGFEVARLEGKTEAEKVRMIFDKDISEIMTADVFFMVLDGRAPDEGACVELGFAYANGKKCYGIKTDTRSLEQGMDINPLIAGCFKKIFRNADGDTAVQELKCFLDEQHTVKNSAQAKISDKYVVCMNEEYVRDAQYLDTKNLSQEEFDTFDYYDCESEELWRDMNPNPFIAIVEAMSEDEACQKAAEQKRYDKRCLFAIKI